VDGSSSRETWGEGPDRQAAWQHMGALGWCGREAAGVWERMCSPEQRLVVVVVQVLGLAALRVSGTQTSMVGGSERAWGGTAGQRATCWAQHVHPHALCRRTCSTITPCSITGTPLS
jgi:hypothetical protein